MFCSNCGAEVGAARFCAVCGGAVDLKTAPPPAPEAAVPQGGGIPPADTVRSPAPVCPAFKKSIIAAVLGLVGLVTGTVLVTVGMTFFVIMFSSRPYFGSSVYAFDAAACILTIAGAVIGLALCGVSTVLGFKTSAAGRAARGRERRALPAFIIGLAVGIESAVAAVAFFAALIAGIVLSV
ncbi:MAG: hypothetical protein LBM78_01560 [Clostridiales bacterium]|jgi:hypothetical protein|nr:hypothetical protein [Clostridiales bacterium]